MIQTGDWDGTGGESIWRDKDKSKDSGTGFENEYFHTFTIFKWEPRHGQFCPNINVVNSIINQNKDDISSKLPTDRFPAKIIDAYKMVEIQPRWW